MVDVILLSVAVLLITSLFISHTNTKKTGTDRNKEIVRNIQLRIAELNTKIKFIEDEILYSKNNQSSSHAIDINLLIEKRKILLNEKNDLENKMRIIITRYGK